MSKRSDEQSRAAFVKYWNKRFNRATYGGLTNQRRAKGTPVARMAYKQAVAHQIAKRASKPDA